MKYATIDDCNYRLQGTYVFYDNKLVYVVGARRNGNQMGIQISDVPDLTGRVQWVSLADPNLNYTRMRFGYVNFRDEALYLMRTPHRHTKQGLTDNNMMFKMPEDQQRRYRFTNALNVQYIDSLNGTYPTYDAVVRTLTTNPEVRSQAFHRNFALRRQELGYFLLEYKGEQCAWGDPEQLKLASHLQYLSNVLNESGVKLHA